MVFPVVVYGCESWTIMKPECWRIDAFELWCWRRLLRIPCISVKFSSVVSDSLWPHGLQHISPPCPSPTPGVYSNSCPLSWWCHSTISSSVVLFSSCPQSFPASGSFQMSQFFTSGGQSIGVSASTISPSNEYPGLISWIQLDWFPLDLKEIKPVNAKGNQPWIFTGRNDAEAEAPTLWPSDQKSRFIGKDLDAGKDWRQKEKWVAKDEMVR